MKKEEVIEYPYVMRDMWLSKISIFFVLFRTNLYEIKHNAIVYAMFVLFMSNYLCLCYVINRCNKITYILVDMLTEISVLLFYSILFRRR